MAIVINYSRRHIRLGSGLTIANSICEMFTANRLVSDSNRLCRCHNIIQPPEQKGLAAAILKMNGEDRKLTGKAGKCPKQVMKSPSLVGAELAVAPPLIVLLLFPAFPVSRLPS